MKEEEGYNDTNRKSIYVMYKIYTKTKIKKGFLILDVHIVKMISHIFALAITY